MAFLHPGLFIAALACVAIPILIHLLLRRRRKPIAWGAMRFLLEAYQKQRSKLRVQQLILLATRCLIVLLVGSAIAGPILEEAGLLGGGAGRDVYILVDNSVASSLREGGVGGEAVIEKHKRTAREIIDALGPGDRAGVVALGAPSRAIVVPASSDLSAVLDVIDSLEPTDSAADIAGALRALTQRSETGEDTSPGAADDAQRTVAILVSEFREGSADVSSALDAGEIELFATPPSERRVDNTQITGVSPLRAVVLTGTGGLSRDEQLRVTLRRDGPSVDEPAVSALSVSFVGLDGQRIGRESRAEVRWDAGQQEKTVTASVDASVSGEAGATGVTSGAIVARIDRDTLDADNTFRLPLAVLESLRVGIVARPRFERGLRADEFGPPEWLSLALRPAASAPIDVIEIEPTTIDTPTLASVDALLLPAPDVIPEGRWQSIRRFADEGGLVIVFPSTRSTVQLWSDAFTSSMALPWRFDREPTDRTESPVSISGETTNTSLLGPIASEINDLLAPVRVTSTLNAAAPGGDGDVVFRLGTGEPWMLAATPGADEATARPGEQRAASRGLVVYIASAMDLAWTDLPARPLMVPLFQELVRQGFGTSSGTRITVAGRPVLAPSRSTRVRSVDDAVAFDASVADSGLLTEPVRQAGLYEARDATARSRGLIGANADAQGARTSPRTQDALGPWLSSASQTPDAGVTWLDPDAPAGALRRAATGSTIGWPLLVLGLCLALIETVMARFFSHAFRDPGRGRAQSEGGRVMQELVRTLLDLRTLSPFGDDVSLGFDRPLPGWGWALVIVGAVLFSVWSYSRLVGTRPLRAGLAVTRAALLTLLVFLVAGPKLVQQTETVERDWILVLVDRSISMTIPDGPVSSGERDTRDAQLARILEETNPQWRELADQREVVWLGFDRGAYELDVMGEGDSPVDAGEPDGLRTRLGASLDAALERAAARPLSAVVILTDGRSADAPGRDALRRLRADRVPVHTIALGSATPIGDFAVARVDAPRTVYADDPAPIRVRIDRSGVPEGSEARVRLVDRATGRTLDEKTIVADSATGDSDEVVLSTTADVPGSRSWSVEIVAGEADLIASNNTQDFEIDVVDEPMRVLFVDGYPRWEQRYLRNMLIRERTVVATTLLLAPNRRYIQEGDVEVDTIPDSPERWAEFDAVILGDVRPDVFTIEQLAMLRDHVAERGAGLIWIAGSGATPSLWWDTPLADLLPMTASGEAPRALAEPAVVFPSAASERLGVLRLTNDTAEPWLDAASDPESGWSILRWVQAIDASRLKPAAEILAQAEELYSYQRTPLILTMRYGSGRSTFVATDEIWRWRYGRGEALFERFWVQLLRMSARESLSRAGRSALFALAPDEPVVGEPVRVSLEFVDQSLIDLQLASVEVELERRPRPGDPLGSETIIERVTLQPEDSARDVYTGVWLPSEPGVWDATPSDAILADLDLSQEIDVTLIDDELRRPDADHALLADLSARTGGRVFLASDAGELFEDPTNLPKRRVVLLNERSESLWDTPLALFLVVLLLTGEWVVRRVIRLI